MDIRTIMEEEQLLPYRRCFRPMMVDGKLDWNAGAAYIQKPEYAKDGAMFVRSFYHIQEELQYLFKYIEPASGNLNTYSHAIQQLLILVCVEVEVKTTTNYSNFSNGSSGFRSTLKWIFAIICTIIVLVITVKVSLRRFF